MSRLQAELQRLYPPADDGAGTLRAVAMELTGPPSWELLGRVWHGVQAELELPAPAIAVSGTDGLQLWFALAESVAADEAQAFLEGLRLRFLPDVAPVRIRLLLHPPPVPSRREPDGNWSAFIAPDLVPVFAETPWLDFPPGDEGQAELLRGLQPIKSAAFETARDRLASSTPAAKADADAAATPPANIAATGDARRFLLQVMNDATVPLALRIDAAKALLAHGG